MLQFPDFHRPKLLSCSDSVENFRFTPNCNFFSSTNHYQAHVQSFGKVLKVFRIFFCDSIDFISIILQGGVIWVHWDFIGFCYVSCCTRIENGSRMKTKIEMILQANG